MLAPKFDRTPFRTPPEVVARALEPFEGIGDALDVCCGTGVALPALRARARGRVVGLDFSRGMLEVATAHLEREGVKDVALVRADALELAYRGEFDLITCFGALGHIVARAQSRFLLGIHRALRPGGRFVFVTTDRPRFGSRAHLLGRAFNAVMHVRNALVSPPFEMFYLTFLLPDIATELRSHGFEVSLRRDLFEAPFDPLVVVTSTRR